MYANNLTRTARFATVLALSFACLSCADRKETRSSQSRGASQPLAAVSAAGPAQQEGTAPVVQTPPDWKNDWSLFVARLAPYVKQGGMAESDVQTFVGQSVTWEGKVSSLAWKEDSPSVSMTMHPVSVILPDGATNTFQDLNLTPKGRNIAGWKGVKTNDTVRFRTTLGTVLDDGTRLPAVFILMQGVPGTDFEGAQFVILMTDDGELIANIDTSQLPGSP